MIMDIHPAGNGWNLDVISRFQGKVIRTTFHRNTRMDLERLVRSITRAQR